MDKKKVEKNETHKNASKCQQQTIAQTRQTEKAREDRERNNKTKVTSAAQ
jgi:hypothetical protein